MKCTRDFDPLRLLDHLGVSQLVRQPRGGSGTPESKSFRFGGQEYRGRYHPVRLRTVGFAYEAQRKSIVPICIASVDRQWETRSRESGSSEGVYPVQEQLRNIARYKLGDVRLVSELAEITVHKLWERHGEDTGVWPWRRVLVRARWEARDMAAGDSQWLIRHTVSAGAWLALNTTSMETACLIRQTTTKSMSESYWSNWLNAGSRAIIARRFVGSSRCGVRGTPGRKSPQSSMTPSPRP